MTKIFVRKNFFINPPFQIRFLVTTIIFQLYALLSFYIMIHLFFVNYLESNILNKLPYANKLNVILIEQHAYMENYIIFISLVLFVGSLIIGIYFSHRISGPMYKLNKIFTEASKEKGVKIKPIFFRGYDFFQEIPDCINEYLRLNNLLEEEVKLEDKPKEEN